jgi:hypothetical protein
MFLMVPTADKMAFGISNEDVSSAPQVRDFAEYRIIVARCYRLIIDGKRIPVREGEEYFIPQGLTHAGHVSAGARTIHAWGGSARGSRSQTEP